MGTFLTFALTLPVTTIAKKYQLKVWTPESEENMPESEKDPTTKKVQFLCHDINDSADVNQLFFLFTLTNFTTVRNNCGVQMFCNIFTPPEPVPVAMS